MWFFHLTSSMMDLANFTTPKETAHVFSIIRSFVRPVRCSTYDLSALVSMQTLSKPSIHLDKTSNINSLNLTTNDVSSYEGLRLTLTTYVQLGWLNLRAIVTVNHRSLCIMEAVCADSGLHRRFSGGRANCSIENGIYVCIWLKSRAVEEISGVGMSKHRTLDETEHN
jgi:hypothetical protein